jgi:hypothetical protein
VPDSAVSAYSAAFFITIFSIPDSSIEGERAFILILKGQREEELLPEN